MNIIELNQILASLSESKRENIFNFAFALMEWMGIEPNGDKKPQLVAPQTQKLREFLVPAPQTVLPQLYRLSADTHNVRIRFAVLKKLKKEYVSQLVDNDPGLMSYQAFTKNISQELANKGYIPSQPYYLHFVTTPQYDKLILIFNQGDQKRLVSFKNRLTTTQYNKILEKWANIGTKTKPEISEIFWKSLDIKEVNKEFYKRIKEQFDNLIEIAKTQDSKVHEEVLKQFAVRLIGRYIFCWFLKEKGIIPKELLESDTILKYKDDFSSTILTKLFFKTLNAEVSDSTRKDIITDLDDLYKSIPYLNGGLFEIHGEDYLFEKLDLNQWLISFVRVLESFDFTVDEGNSQYQHVAIDPEILGRIFENLLASQNPETEKMANQRKAFGAFYTPREIVDYMVNESLKAHLETALFRDIIKISDTVNEPLAEFNQGLFAAQKLEEPKPTAYSLKTDSEAKEKEKILSKIEKFFAVDCSENPFDKAETEVVKKALSEITVLDPACGSGAFPMGVMLRLMELRQIIGHGHRNNYDLKEEILSKNIFGIDIMPMAVEIARLRAWLSLVLESDFKPADKKNNFGIAALPNLDFKFICANSLIDSGYDDFASKLSLNATLYRLDGEIQKLERIRNDYFDPKGDKTIKKQLQKDFFETKDYIKSQISHGSLLKNYNLTDFFNKVDDWNPFDDSRPASFFSPSWMFGINKGFDLVIGNPPYIGSKGNEKIFHDILKTSVGKKYFSRWMDYFYLFFHIGIDVLKDKGYLTLITTNYYFTSTGGAKLRSDIKIRTNITSLFNFGEFKVFESAVGQHNVITMLEKSKTKEKNCITYEMLKNVESNPEILTQILSKSSNYANKSTITQHNLYEGTDNQIRIQGMGNTVNSSITINDVLQKLTLNTTELGKITRMTMGVVTLSDTVSNTHLQKHKINAKKGDGIYVLTNEEVENLNLSIIDKNRFIKPFYKNSEIEHYKLPNNNNHWLFYCKDQGVPIELPEGLKRHFEKFSDLIIKLKQNFLKNEIAASVVKKWLNNGNYFVLFTPKKETYFTCEKIVAPYRSKSNHFAFSSEPFFGSKDIAYILPKSKEYHLKYLTCILNSKLIFHWFYNKGKRKGDILELYIKPLSVIPIKHNPKQEIFIKLHDDVVEGLKSDNDVSELIQKIDTLIYKLYELTFDEVIIIDSNFAISEEEYNNIQL